MHTLYILHTPGHSDSPTGAFWKVTKAPACVSAYRCWFIGVLATTPCGGFGCEGGAENEEECGRLARGCILHIHSLRSRGNAVCPAKHRREHVVRRETGEYNASHILYPSNPRCPVSIGRLARRPCMAVQSASCWAVPRCASLFRSACVQTNRRFAHCLYSGIPWTRAHSSFVSAHPPVMCVFIHADRRGA